MGKMMQFFDGVKKTGAKVSVETNLGGVGIDGEGIYIHVTPEGLDKGYESLKTRAAQQTISMADRELYRLESNMAQSEYENYLRQSNANKNRGNGGYGGVF